MSQFYARYVPPAQGVKTVSEEAKPISKRKRSSEDKEVDKIKRKKHRQSTDGGREEKAIRAADGSTLVGEATTSSRSQKVEKVGHNDVPSTPVESVRDTTTTKKKEKRKQKLQPSDDISKNIPDEDNNSKHGNVLSRFNKARAERRPEENHEEEANDAQPEELHGLEPIPQPEVVDLPKQKPSYSTLAPWQANAVRVVTRQTKAFKDLKISPAIIDNLKKYGIEKSFPVQTTVLPLLLEGEQKHSGDVCVSAATGSGKTLAYVVPIVEDLKDYANTQLRAVIVVPTRELVQQVRQLCEICAAGTKLKVAAASGSKALKDEQDLLVVEEEMYDPEQWEKDQKAPMDWSNFAISSFLQDAQRQSQARSIHFVKRAFSKADILITTPGRLVDHLMSTPGFNLDHVKWLVVDEADRLLNESYQEWIDTVMPALQSQAATSKRDDLVRSMRMQPPLRQVQKVLLSATMTSDISKLSSLGLSNPKLVILGHPQSESHSYGDDSLDIAEAKGDFHLPQTLSENVLPLKDGYEKPLYLLELLQQRILPRAAQTARLANGVHDSSDSSSGSDSDSSLSTDTDFESDSGTDSESESDSIDSTSSSASSVSSTDNPPALKRKIDASKALFNQSKPGRRSAPTGRALIFTRSTSAATRLSRLLTLLSPQLTSKISTLTKSTSSSSASRRALSAFRSGKSTILIATDRASRGLDIPDLEHVISYDVPSSALTYVHRVGRTARAGKEGTAWTILEHREGKWFWQEIGGKGKDDDNKEGTIRREQGRKVQKVTNLEVDIESWKERYDSALAKLGEEVKAS